MVVWLNYKQDLVLWPSANIPFYYSDRLTEDKGNSDIRQVLSPPNVLSYEYYLGDSFIYPYVGVSFLPDSSDHFFDLSDYDEVLIEIEGHFSRLVPVVLNQDIDGYTKENDGLSFRPFTKEIVYENGQRSYTLDLSDFKTPSWWYSKQSLTEHEIGKPDFSRIRTFQFHDCELIPLNKKETFSIYGIRFKKSMTGTYILALFFILSYHLCVYLIKRSRTKGSLLLPRKELTLSNIADDEAKRILEYLAENYPNPELSLETVQRNLGVSESKISSIIKDTSGLTFKRYLNTIRIEESKRILLSTDRPVMDIAYKVGYGNISHFNRVFKETEGCSPNEYRKNTPKKS